MYVILVYDMKLQRVGRMLKLCRRYLHWIQNSVFEGEISEVKLAELLAKARTIMDEDEDSVKAVPSSGWKNRSWVANAARWTLFYSTDWSSEKLPLQLTAQQPTSLLRNPLISRVV